MSSPFSIYTYIYLYMTKPEYSSIRAVQICLKSVGRFGRLPVKKSLVSKKERAVCLKLTYKHY